MRVFCVYSLKAAAIQLACSFATEFGPYGVPANCIVLGLVRTDFARRVWRNPTLLQDMLTGTKLGRIGEPDDVAVTDVPGQRCRPHVTGKVILLDGGTTVTLAKRPSLASKVHQSSDMTGIS